MNVFTNLDIEKKFSEYPRDVRVKMLALRELVLRIACESSGGAVEETLKWSEPSWIVKGGSTVRMDWKHTTPNEYRLYFNCQTTLVETFRELYNDSIRFEGNRAIVLRLDESVPEEEIGHCLQLAFEYHKRKKLHLLGA